MSFHNNLPGTPTGMPRLMRPKAVAVSPIHSPIGNVIARPVVSMMSSQGQSQQYVLGARGAGAVPQVYQGARLTQTVSSQPRLSAQVMYPAQQVQLAGRVPQNRPAGVHSYHTVAFQNVPYTAQRPAAAGQPQVQPRAQVLIASRPNSGQNQAMIVSRGNSGQNPAMFQTVASTMGNPFQAQTQHRYPVPAHVGMQGKQIIMTQSHQGMIPAQATANVIPPGVVQRMNSARIISQQAMPVRVQTVNQNMNISLGTSSHASKTVSNTSPTVSLISPNSVSITSATSNTSNTEVPKVSSGPPSVTNFTATSVARPEDFLNTDVTMPVLSSELPNIDNMDVSLPFEVPINTADGDMADSDLGTTPQMLLASEYVSNSPSMDSVILMSSTDEGTAGLYGDDSKTASQFDSVENVYSVDILPKPSVSGTGNDKIVIDPLLGDQPMFEAEENSSNSEGLTTNTEIEKDGEKTAGEMSEGLVLSATVTLSATTDSVTTEKMVESESCDKSVNENLIDNDNFEVGADDDNSMDTEFTDHPMADIDSLDIPAESEHVNDTEASQNSQSEIDDDNSQESGPGFSEKALSTCQYCSDEDSQHTGISSDLYTTEDSNISWEKFHEKVLNLRVNKDRGKANVESKILACEGDSGTKVLEETAEGAEKVHEEEACADDNDEEPDFIWEDYLQQIGASAVPPTAFKHVECSLQSCFMKGMKLEIRNKSDESTFWVATVIMTCGPLLRLRYDGYGEDSSNDFWCDFATTELHHIGWSAQNGKNLQPPDEIKDKVSDWRTFLMESLTGARTAPSCFLEKNSGITPVDQIKYGMWLELQDILNPLQVWLVQVLENVGGRLYLRLEGTQSACKHFWMFYLNPRLHPIGWATEQGDCVYKPPQDIAGEQTDEKWEEILQTVLKECKNDVVPDDVFKDQSELKHHQFTVGMKLEALSPGLNQIGPATVIKVINNNYFVVEMDDLRPAEKRASIQICCNSEYLGIFPVSWCQCKGIRMAPPPGWTNTDFVWGEYLSFCNAKAAPEKLFTSGTDDHDFERGMKLEAVNPSNPNQICAATITKIVGPLLWIHLDHMRDIPSHIEDIDSHNIFPVGWCESNNYQLKPPLKSKPKQKPQSECKTEEVYRSITSSRGKGAWCPKIYFNHRCFSGPYLSKGRISDLPKHVGPGPMDLVLKEVLRLLVSIAYVPCRAMKEIQLDDLPNPYMKSHILKAKYKGKKYKVMVEVCQTESQLEEFCRNICIKLECCPYLFSQLRVADSCPENCQQLTKTKSNPGYVKKKKVGNVQTVKPSAAERENKERKRGRKRKRFLFVQKKGQQQAARQQAEGTHHDHQRDEGFIDDYEDDDGNERRSYDIQTRGAKLPKYSFERRTHKKILMSQSKVHINNHQSIKEFKQAMYNRDWSDEVKAQSVGLQRQEGSIKLESNPLHWSVNDVVQYVKTTDCSHLARIMKEQEVDGQAFLLMNLSVIQEHLELKLGPAVKLCHQIERLKVAFFENYA